MVRAHSAEGPDRWLAACLVSGIGEVVTFAEGLQREVVSVRAALEQPYSNGVAEGNITRLKQIRRAMYDRGNFDLLRIPQPRTVLCNGCAAHPPSPASRARRIASARSATCNLLKMFET